MDFKLNLRCYNSLCTGGMCAEVAECTAYHIALRVGGCGRVLADGLLQVEVIGVDAMVYTFKGDNDRVAGSNVQTAVEGVDYLAAISLRQLFQPVCQVA